MVHKLAPGGLLEERCLSEEEAEGVQPGKEDAGHDLANTCFAETEIVATDNGRVHEEHSTYMSGQTLQSIKTWNVVHYLVASAPYWSMTWLGSG